MGCFSATNSFCFHFLMTAIDVPCFLNSSPAGAKRGGKGDVSKLSLKFQAAFLLREGKAEKEERYVSHHV